MSIEIARGPLLIRSWQVADAEALSHAIEQNLEHLRPFLAWALDEPKPIGERRAMIAAWNEQATACGDETVGLFFGGGVVGGAGLHQRIGPGGLEIGYWVHRAYARRGFATSAARALTDHAFATPGVDRVEIKHDAANVASAGVPARLGFRRVGGEPREPKAPAETGVHVVWWVTREEWAAANPT